MNSGLVFTYELLDWIDEKNIDFGFLSANPNAIDLLKKNIEKIDWYRLSDNPNASQILEKYPEKIF